MYQNQSEWHLVKFGLLGQNSESILWNLSHTFDRVVSLMAKENIDTNLQQSAPGKPVSGLGTVVVRNEFYRDGYRSLLKLVILLSLIIGILVLAILGIINSRQPENRYFATTEDGRLIPMVALNQPNLSTPALLSWVAQAATEVMTFGFNDYRRRLQESSRNFTRTG